MASTSRRQARIAALQTLYEVDSTAHPVEEVLRRNLDEPASENPNATGISDPAGREFASALVEGVLEQQRRAGSDHRKIGAQLADRPDVEDR